MARMMVTRWADAGDICSKGPTTWLMPGDVPDHDDCLMSLTMMTATFSPLTLPVIHLHWGLLNHYNQEKIPILGTEIE